jgi:hypothetical protein
MAVFPDAIDEMTPLIGYLPEFQSPLSLISYAEHTYSVTI